MARLLLDQLLPSELNKILYLDGDTINISSLTKLWNLDMGNCVLGACIEATINQTYRENLGMKNLPYVNAGVLLINLKKWRDEKIGAKIL